MSRINKKIITGILIFIIVILIGIKNSYSYYFKCIGIVNGKEVYEMEHSHYLRDYNGLYCIEHGRHFNENKSTFYKWKTYYDDEFYNYSSYNKNNQFMRGVAYIIRYGIKNNCNGYGYDNARNGGGKCQQALWMLEKWWKDQGNALPEPFNNAQVAPVENLVPGASELFEAAKKAPVTEFQIMQILKQMKQLQ